MGGFGRRHVGWRFRFCLLLWPDPRFSPQKYFRNTSFEGSGQIVGKLNAPQKTLSLDRVDAGWRDTRAIREFALTPVFPLAKGPESVLHKPIHLCRKPAIAL